MDFLTYRNLFSFFKDFIYLFEREKEREEENRGRSSLPTRRESDAGLDPRTL